MPDTVEANNQVQEDIFFYRSEGDEILRHLFMFVFDLYKILSLFW